MPSPTSKGLREYTDLHVGGLPPVDHRSELEHREVVLRERCGVWAAGTGGFIVDPFLAEATVEIMDAEGQTLDLLTVPYDALTVLDEVEQEHLAI